MRQCCPPIVITGMHNPCSRLTLALEEVCVHIQYSYCHYMKHRRSIAAERSGAMLYSNQKNIFLTRFFFMTKEKGLWVNKGDSPAAEQGVQTETHDCISFRLFTLLNVPPLVAKIILHTVIILSFSQRKDHPCLKNYAAMTRLVTKFMSIDHQAGDG